MYKVGQSSNLGSEKSAYECGKKKLGHKGQEGSDPNYPNDKDHIAFITKIRPTTKIDTVFHETFKFVVSRKCSCGLEWDFPVEEADISE